MTKRIPLSGKRGEGLWILVDEQDYEFLSRYKWFVVGVPERPYAATYLVPSDRKQSRMHQVLMPAPMRMTVDHINGNTLDNRRANLRFCTHQQNMHNRRNKAKSPSRFKGVGWQSRDGKWRARIKFNGKDKYLGLYDDEVEAAKRYDAAALTYFGEFACLNFPDEVSS